MNQHSGNKWTISTARKVPLNVWETAVIKEGFMKGFSAKNIVYVYETIGEDEEWTKAVHVGVSLMARDEPEADWLMTFEEVRMIQSETADSYKLLLGMSPSGQEALWQPFYRTIASRRGLPK